MHVCCGLISSDKRRHLTLPGHGAIHQHPPPVVRKLENMNRSFSIAFSVLKLTMIVVTDELSKIP